MSNQDEIVLKNNKYSSINNSKRKNEIEATKPGTPFEEMENAEATYALEWREHLASSSEDLSVQENMSSQLSDNDSSF